VYNIELDSLIIADPTRSTRSLGQELSISHTTVRHYLDELGMEFGDKSWLYPKNSNETCTTNSSQLSTSTAQYNYSTSFVDNFSVLTSSTIQQ
jgi:hypothetical protein